MEVETRPVNVVCSAVIVVAEILREGAFPLPASKVGEEPDLPLLLPQSNLFFETQLDQVRMDRNPR